MSRKACVIGSGPNGLAAAIVLAQAGLQVDVFEAEPIPGGAARTMELTLPGFLHDFGSAVHPMAAGSPFFSSLPLESHDLEWIHSPAPLAHPLDDGTAITLERDLKDAQSALGVDGETWCRLTRPLVEHWSEFAPEVLRPLPSIPKHPWLMARFGMSALLSARKIVQRFRSVRTRALFAGLAAHSLLSLDEPLSGAFGMLMAIPAHAVGWPIPRGGSQSLTNALCRYLSTFASTLKTSSRIESLTTLSHYAVICCDVTPRLPRKRPRVMHNMRIARLFCWYSRVCSIPRAPLPANTQSGLIATFQMVPSSTCEGNWRIRLSALRPVFGNVF